MMRKSELSVFLFAPSVGYAAAPLYLDFGALLLTVALYATGAVAVLIWLARSPSGSRKAYLWKCIVALAYFVALPGYPVAQKAYMTAQYQRAEERRAEERAKAKAKYKKFCLENLKREQPLEACKKFGPLDSNAQQTTAK